MSTPLIVLATIAFYFFLLFIISWITGRKADNAGFFTGNRKSPWYMVAIAMIGAPISGVTFISVPGAVAANSFSYLQMVFGFFVGYLLVAYVLIPMFYRMNLVSIYGYLENRFGMTSYHTGAWFFFVSKMLGASVRFFVVCVVLQTLVFDAFNIPFELNVLLTVALIWLYSSWGGVKSLIWTDTLKTICLVVSLVCCILFISNNLGYNIGDLYGAISADKTSKVFFFDDANSNLYFWKQFLAGIFMVIAMTGLDQDLMQRTMSCKNFRESQKNLVVAGVMQIFVIALFLVLGTLLYQYASTQRVAYEKPDEVFGAVAWSNGFPIAIGILFIIGLIAASYSAAGSALTALTTSFTVDILHADNKKDDKQLTTTRKRVHLVMSALMIITIIVFYYLNNDSAINAVYSLASYTYGPILGMFVFGMATKRKVRDGGVAIVCIIAPIISWVLQTNSEVWFGGYKIGFELLLINALLTVMGMTCLIKEKSV